MVTPLLARFGVYRDKKMGMHDQAVEAARETLGRSLERAIAQGQFELHYQPQVRVATGEVVGMEALIRWHHPALGFLLPAQFIPIAENKGLIAPIAEWVLRTACRQNHAWQQSGLPFLKVSVNLSALEFRQAGFVDLVRRILAETALEPRYLDLELSESLVLGAANSMLERVNALKALGVVVSIDDCGNGYAGVGHFMNYPLYQLKIDRSFVRHLPDGDRAASVARSIVSMGSGLGVRVLAAGVETSAQLGFLRGIRCEYAQGNLYTVPLPTRAFEAWVRKPDSSRAPSAFDTQPASLHAH
ncbi:MAG: EAL domain-containing protein [Betaproteobacteria bacterium]